MGHGKFFIRVRVRMGTYACQLTARPGPDGPRTGSGRLTGWQLGFLTPSSRLLASR